MKTKALALTAALFSLPLAACSNMEGSPLRDISWPSLSSTQKSGSQNGDAALFAGNNGACPNIKTLPELSTLTHMRAGTQDAKALISETVLVETKSTCQQEGNTLNIDLTLSFKSVLGPEALKSGTAQSAFSEPYFVAVTDSQGVIISKDVFAVPITFGKDEIQQHTTEKLQQKIQLQNGQRGGNFNLFIGFQLTEEELARNKARVGLPSPAVAKPESNDLPVPTGKLVATEQAPPLPVIKPVKAEVKPEIKAEEKPEAEAEAATPAAPVSSKYVAGGKLNEAE